MTAADTVRDLLTVEVRDDSAGYLDVLEPAPTTGSVGLRAMQSPVLAAVYQRLWRPMFTRLFSWGGSATADADRRLLDRIRSDGGPRILDVACGPGTHTRAMADGDPASRLCVGLDFSSAMLRRAVADNQTESAVYLRADAHRIPFPDQTFDTVTCLAALYLMPDPMHVLDEMARVVAPGGEVVVFTTMRTPISDLPGLAQLTRWSGIRVFEPDELTDRLTQAGLTHVRQHRVGQGQYVVASRPGPPDDRYPDGV